jgi:DNA-binding transcriptional regulator YiaG
MGCRLPSFTEAVPVSRISYAQPTPAERIRELLRRTGLDETAAARELEVDDRTLRYWCSGQVEPPKMALLALERLIELQRQVT